jgi:carboxymethylenebutenolidase
VVQEIFGVHEHIKDMCRRYAKRGYYAIAPEMFARQGDVSKMIGHPHHPAAGAVQGARRPGLRRPRRHAWPSPAPAVKADAQRTGLVGYCWGGRTAWVYARHNEHPECRRGVLRVCSKA